MTLHADTMSSFSIFIENNVFHVCLANVMIAVLPSVELRLFLHEIHWVGPYDLLDLKLLLVIRHATKNGTPVDAMLGDTNCLCEGRSMPAGY